MIKLKNGYEIEYTRDIDIFLQNLVKSIIRESLKSINPPDHEDNVSDENHDELILKEIMDNCIYVTHQIFELSKADENLSKFLTTGFLFNYVMLLFQRFRNDIDDKPQGSDKAKIH
jgi:hypothetical protein